MAERVTIQDIADALGLSRNTVSKAINNTGSLADATREKILQKAVELGYKQFSYMSLPDMESAKNAETLMNGITAAELLISRIREPSLNFRTVHTETTLIYRESTGDQTRKPKQEARTKPQYINVKNKGGKCRICVCFSHKDHGCSRCRKDRR